MCEPTRRNFALTGADAFTVQPNRILELNWRRVATLDKPGLHMKVAVKNKKGEREIRRDYYFYNSRGGCPKQPAVERGRPPM